MKRVIPMLECCTTASYWRTLADVPFPMCPCPCPDVSTVLPDVLVLTCLLFFLTCLCWRVSCLQWWTAGRSAWTSPSPRELTRRPPACTWAGSYILHGGVLYSVHQCVTNIRIRIRIRIRICEYQSEYLYSPFFVTPNIFVFVFALFYQPKYICIRICLRHGKRIY